MKFLLLLFIVLSPVVYCQNDDWGCNHIGTIPTDTCIGSSLSAVEYVCNGTDTYSIITYDDVDDCESGTDGTVTSGYSIGSSSECDNNGGCGYFKIDCAGVTTVFIVDVCYSISGISTEYSCSSSSLTAKVYSSDDCTGSSSSGTTNYGSLTTYDSCDFDCIGGGSSGSSGFKNKYLFIGALICLIIIW